jgi:predicted PurR-regulated permease PerM
MEETCMPDAAEQRGDPRSVREAVEIAIRIGVLLLLAVWCFLIIRPFITTVAWGIIIAIAVFPVYDRLKSILKGRRRLSATIVSLLLLLFLIAPVMMLMGTLVNGIEHFSPMIREHGIHVPLPPARIAQLPLVGEPVAKFWTLASQNQMRAIEQIEPQLTAVGGWLFSAAAGAGFITLQLLFAIVVAGVLLANSGGGAGAARAIEFRLLGDRGAAFTDLAAATVRSVVRGVLGVAVIQSILAGVGMLLAGIQAAGLWALLCLLLCIIQVGPLPVLIPVVAYLFFIGSKAAAVVFLLWSVVIVALDNTLKPLLMGRGMSVPMIVIFVGALGGMLAMGIIGLFVGSTVLVVGFTLFKAWLGEPEPIQKPLVAASEPVGKPNAG